MPRFFKAFYLPTPCKLKKLAQKSKKGLIFYRGGCYTSSVLRIGVTAPEGGQEARITCFRKRTKGRRTERRRGVTTCIFRRRAALYKTKKLKYKECMNDNENQ